MHNVFFLNKFVKHTIWNGHIIGHKIAKYGPYEASIVANRSSKSGHVEIGLRYPKTAGKTYIKIYIGYNGGYDDGYDDG